MVMIRRPLVKVLRKIRPGPPDRYPNLFRLIRENKAKRIMEIGTWNGEHALQMIATAQKHHPKSKVEYYGFDLFESMTSDKFDEEYAKMPPAMKEVENKLQKSGASVKLFMGDTNVTLKKNLKSLPRMDFIFIDGGHSIKTIENDWRYSSRLMHKSTTVVLDDYFRNTEPEVRGVGCQSLIDGLDRKKYHVEILEPECHFKKDWGTLNIRMVKVILNPQGRKS
jgi:predicted O-methyltransferase YrrM